MADLHTSLMTAVGKAALARHRESCSLCAADRPCVVANTHLCPPDRLHAPSTKGGEDRG